MNDYEYSALGQKLRDGGYIGGQAVVVLVFAFENRKVHHICIAR